MFQPLALSPEPRRARHNNADKTAYSVTCAILRMTPTILSVAGSDRSGLNHRSNGPMILEERGPEWESEDAEKINAIQITTGNQYLKKTGARITAR